MNVKQFKHLLSTMFGITCPKYIVFEEKLGGIRAFSKSLMSFKPDFRGFTVFSNGSFTHAFAMAFGHLADKHVIDLDKYELKNVLMGKSIEVDTENGTYIARFKSYPVCIGFVENGIFYPSIPKKFRRAIYDV